MSKGANLGCGRTLLISFGVLALFILGTALWYRGTVAQMFDNMMAMNEGADAAKALRTPADLLDYLALQHANVSLVVFDTEQPEEGLYFRAEVARPVAGVSRLVVLAEFARQVAAGTLDASAAVEGEALRAYDLRARRAAVRDTLPETLTLADVARRMMQRGDGAAADLLIRRLGRDSLDALPARLGLDGGLGAPLPQSGLHLSWHSDAALDAPAAPYADSVYAFTARLEEDAAFRQRAVARRRSGEASLSLSRQRTLAAATYPQGTAAAYGALLRRLAADTLFSGEATRLMRAAIERPLPGGASGFVGSKAGSFPGLISFAGYVRHADRPGGRVVVLLMERVPTAVFYHLVQTGLDNVFELQLLLDDAFFAQARERLARAPAGGGTTETAEQ